MNNDKELLELAAKAAGIEIISDAKEKGLWIKHKFLAWNPLTDDGDALRLAVKLKLIVTFADGGCGPHVCAGQRLGTIFVEKLPVKVFADDEETAATRRAIVRAAAEIGMGME